MILFFDFFSIISEILMNLIIYKKEHMNARIIKIL